MNKEGTQEVDPGHFIVSAPKTIENYNCNWSTPSNQPFCPLSSNSKWCPTEWSNQYTMSSFDDSSPSILFLLEWDLRLWCLIREGLSKVHVSSYSIWCLTECIKICLLSMVPTPAFSSNRSEIYDSWCLIREGLSKVFPDVTEVSFPVVIGAGNSITWLSTMWLFRMGISNANVFPEPYNNSYLKNFPNIQLN